MVISTVACVEKEKNIYAESWTTLQCFGAWCSFHYLDPVIRVACSTLFSSLILSARNRCPRMNPFQERLLLSRRTGTRTNSHVSEMASVYSGTSV